MGNIKMEKSVSDISLSRNNYGATYRESVDNNEPFWAQQAERLHWQVPFKSVKNVSFQRSDFRIRWFEDGELNVCENCVDRHLPEKSEQTAIIWQGDKPELQRRISFKELHVEVCKLANALESLGVESGDRVILYMPMVPEAAYAMLACARIGAIHSAVFGGFSAASLRDRIEDCAAKVVITADCAQRGGKLIPLKQTVDAALEKLDTPLVDKVIVLAHHDQSMAAERVRTPRDIDYSELVERQSAQHLAPAFEAEHPLFVLYTSGSTGKPKGIQHASGGYLCYAETTFREAFDFSDSDIFWCSADIGWITGHSYVVYGPLAAGATTLMFEGVPNSPDLARFAQVIDQHKVSIFYTAPTVIRMLMTNPSQALSSTKRDSLRILGTVGEPINPEVWRWFHDEFGKSLASVVDTWWQTETGGHMILPLPKMTQPKPGAAGKPFFGIQPALVDTEGAVLEGEASGHLVITDSWPGQGRSIWGDHQRFIDTYFSNYDGMYFSGDGAKRDADGHYWITGRVDDVLNVSGHRLGTAEIESAAVRHPQVAEAAVVGFPHKIKGEAIYVYLVPVAGAATSEALSAEVKAEIREALGPIASPEAIQWVRDLPKTRSGKIMRRILRKVADNQFESLGDLSTLAEPGVVAELIDGKKRSQGE